MRELIFNAAYVVWVGYKGVYGDRDDFIHYNVTLDVSVMNSYCRSLSKAKVLKWATASQPRMIKSSLRGADDGAAQPQL